jgi:hypothetical protein
MLEQEEVEAIITADGFLGKTPEKVQAIGTRVHR